MSKDFDKIANSVVSLLISRSDPFRANLSDVARAAGVSSTPRRQLFDLYSDALTLNSVIEKVGDWCLAEVEGNDVQFNKIVDRDDEGVYEDVVEDKDDPVLDKITFRPAKSK